MSILVWIILGLIAGWLAGFIMGSGYGLVGNLVPGVLGAMIGGWLGSTWFGLDVTGLNFTSIVLSVIGAVILIAILRLVRLGRGAAG